MGRHFRMFHVHSTVKRQSCREALKFASPQQVSHRLQSIFITSCLSEVPSALMSPVPSGINFLCNWPQRLPKLSEKYGLYTTLWGLKKHVRKISVNIY